MLSEQRSNRDADDDDDDDFCLKQPIQFNMLAINCVEQIKRPFLLITNHMNDLFYPPYLHFANGHCEILNHQTYK